MFGGLEDGVAEPIPALMDEDIDLESLFAGETMSRRRERDRVREIRALADHYLLCATIWR